MSSTLPESDVSHLADDNVVQPSPPHHQLDLPADSDSGSGTEMSLEPQHDRSDFIEQIFQKVEQESERRAREEQLDQGRSRPSTGNRPSSAGKGAATTAGTRDRARDRRRGSISVSRFGQATDLSSGTTDNPSNLPSRKNSLIIKVGNTGAFYQAQKHTGSADSFASNEGAEPVHEDVHDEEQVTQMETIAGRVSLGKAMGRTIARRLSRARTRSRDILVVPNGLVIGVSVEEATTEAEHPEEEEGGDMPMTPSSVSFQVYAQVAGTGSRSRRSTVSMLNPPPSLAAPSVMPVAPTSPMVEKRSSSWVTKAKDFTKMIKRRSMAVLPQQSLNSSP